ncbi:MAG: serine hydrolase domain-containing protein [Myxococcota bacterium]
MDTERRIQEDLDGAVERGELAGVVVSAWRDGRQLEVASGWLDREAKVPLQPDGIFRIASLTKPITSVVALQLWEAGRFDLDDPIDRWAPELRELRVMRSPADLTDTAPAPRPVTFLDLLTHRAGFTYGSFHGGALGRAYRDALGADIDSVLAPDAWIAGLGRLPLVDPPGRTLHYGHSTDLLGLLVERMEDAPLDLVFRRRLFEPLGMGDTGFVVPLAKRHRRAASYGFDADGASTKLERPPGDVALTERPAELRFMSGGQGLWSTASDYLTFTRIFLERGSVGGVRVLEPRTVERMCANVLDRSQRATAEVAGLPLFTRGHGFGLGVAVVMEPEHCAVTVCSGGVGTVGWPGAYGGWWQADPASRTAVVFLTHSMPTQDQLECGVGFETYAAIERVHRRLWPGPAVAPHRDPAERPG